LIEPKPNVVGLTLTVPGTAPVPDSATDCGLLLAESVKRSEAVRVPAAVGLNTILAAQLADAVRLVPHVLLKIAKSAAFVPEIAVLLIVIDEASLFVKVTDCAALLEPTAIAANVRFVGLAETLPVGAVPFPESAIVWMPAESLKFNVAVRVPVVVGAKTILAVQLADAARVVLQVLLKILKSPAFAPESVRLLIVIDAALLFVSVTVFCAPMPPTGTAAQLRPVGEAVTAAMQFTAPSVPSAENTVAVTLSAQNRERRTAVRRLRARVELSVRKSEDESKMSPCKPDGMESPTWSYFAHEPDLACVSR